MHLHSNMQPCDKPITSDRQLSGSHAFTPLLRLLVGVKTFASGTFLHSERAHLTLSYVAYLRHVHGCFVCAGEKYCGSAAGRALCFAHPTRMLQVSHHLRPPLLSPQSCLHLVCLFAPPGHPIPLRSYTQQIRHCLMLPLLFSKTLREVYCIYFRCECLAVGMV